LKLFKTEFKDLIIIQHKINYDERGFFKEIFKKKDLETKVGYQLNFCQDNIVKSSKMVLRGLHFQKEPYSQAKLVSVIQGRIIDMVVDIRKESKTYGKIFKYELSENKHQSLFIPRGFAHGYLTVSEKAIVSYKVDNYYNKKSEVQISFKDPFLKTDIDFDRVLMSQKDNQVNKFKW
tara:strand:- start:238 stop:768 length:531 start_codon:yes stop_codon:yes gene_type:complete